MPTYAKLGMIYNISNNGMPTILTVLSDNRFSEISEIRYFFERMCVCVKRVSGILFDWSLNSWIHRNSFIKEQKMGKNYKSLTLTVTAFSICWVIFQGKFIDMTFCSQKILMSLIGSEVRGSIPTAFLKFLWLYFFCFMSQ